MGYVNTFEAVVEGIEASGCVIMKHPWEDDAVVFASEKSHPCASVIVTSKEVVICALDGKNTPYDKTQALDWVFQSSLGVGKSLLSRTGKEKIPSSPPRGSVEVVRTWAAAKGWEQMPIPTPPEGWVSRDKVRIRMFPRANGHWAFYKDVDEWEGEPFIRQWPPAPNNMGWPVDGRQVTAPYWGLPAKVYKNLLPAARQLESVWLVRREGAWGGWAMLGRVGIYINKQLCDLPRSVRTPEFHEAKSLTEEMAHTYIDSVSYPDSTLMFDVGMIPSRGTLTLSGDRWTSSEGGEGQIEASIDAGAIQVAVPLLRGCVQAVGARRIVSIGVGKIQGQQALMLDGPRGVVFLLPMRI